MLAFLTVHHLLFALMSRKSGEVANLVANSGDRLRVDLKRHLHRRVPQQLLHRLDVLAVGFQQCREGAPERVPSDVLSNFRSVRSGTKRPREARVRTVRQLSPFARTGEDKWIPME